MPLTYSIARYAWPDPLTPASYSRAMLGWVRARSLSHGPRASLSRSSAWSRYGEMRSQATGSFSIRVAGATEVGSDSRSRYENLHGRFSPSVTEDGCSRNGPLRKPWMAL